MALALRAVYANKFPAHRLLTTRASVATSVVRPASTLKSVTQLLSVLRIAVGAIAGLHGGVGCCLLVADDRCSLNELRSCGIVVTVLNSEASAVGDLATVVVRDLMSSVGPRYTILALPSLEYIMHS